MYLFSHLSRVRRCATTLALIFVSLHLLATPIDSVTAKRRAQAQWEKMQQAGGHMQRSNSRDEGLRMATHDGSSYLFKHTDGAFILTAANDALPEILGYGYCRNEEIPAALKTFRQTLKYIKPQETRTISAAYVPTGPLLTTVRHQKAPYNNYCPHYTDDHGTTSSERCVVGCVATALEEVLTYYRREYVLADTLHGWSTAHYTVQSMLPGEKVDSRLILDNYDTGEATAEEIDAVAKLSLMCGIAARMNWGPNESGARVSHLVEPLRRAFALPYVHYADSYKYSPEDWTAMMRAEIYAGRPVLYAGYTGSMSGHAFVLDGIDESGFYHVNWGYGGNYDGYFRLDLLNFAEPQYDLGQSGIDEGFFCNQEALFICPDVVDNALPDTLARTGREIQVLEVTPLLPPETKKMTPIQCIIKNTSNYPLTTPFEYFTHATTDTVRFEGADFVALSGVTLLPQAVDTCIIHATFSEAGERLFCISPDDVEILWEQPLTIQDGVAAQIEFDRPLIDFPATGTTRVDITYRNLSTDARAGQRLIAEVVEGIYDGTQEGTRHTQKIYTQPSAEETATFLFNGLKTGQSYTLLLRSPWKIQHSIKFIQGVDAAISSPTLVPNDSNTLWYSPDGKRLPRRPERGIAVSKDRKVWFKK